MIQQRAKKRERERCGVDMPRYGARVRARRRVAPRESDEGKRYTAREAEKRVFREALRDHYIALLTDAFYVCNDHIDIATIVARKRRIR